MLDEKLLTIKKEMQKNKVSLDLSDLTLFGNDTGEHEDPKILNSYFLDKPAFRSFFSEEIPISIVSARKGMGKSTILSKLDYMLKKDCDKKIVIRTTGSELLGLGEFVGKDPVYLENYWKQIICKSINIEIGKELGFALSDEEITMVEAAELENMKGRNIVGTLLDRLEIKIGGNQIQRRSIVPSNWKNLLENYQNKHAKSTLWLLVDDIDARFINSEDYQNRISSFFTAIVSLATSINN